MGRIGRSDADHRLVVVNPLSFERTDVVRVARFKVSGPIDVIDEATGDRVPHQILALGGPQAPVPYAAYRHARGAFEPHELRDLIFVAEGVPAMGYRTYRIMPRTDDGPSPHPIKVGPGTLENRFFRIAVDPKTGGVRSLFDKQHDRELADAKAAHTINQFVMRWVQTGEVSDAQRRCRSVRDVTGRSVPASSSQRKAPAVHRSLKRSWFTTKLNRIDFANRILKDSTPLQEVYFAFPFAIDSPDFRFEGSNSVVKPFRDQFPGSNTNYYAVQHWADVSDGEVGVTLSPVESHLLEFGGLWPCYVSQAHHGVDPAGYGAPFVQPEQISRGHMYAFVMDSNFPYEFPAGTAKRYPLSLLHDDTCRRLA